MRRPESHRAIIDAAQKILADEGYGGFTFDAVAKRAGSSKPTLYRWWPNKAVLIMELYERAGEAALDIADHGALEPDMTALLERLWKWWRETWAGEAFRSLIAEAQLSGEAQDELRNIFIPRRRAVLRKVFDRAQARGDLGPHADIESAISLMMGVSLAHLLTGTLDDQRAAAQAVRVILDGVR